MAFLSPTNLAPLIPNAPVLAPGQTVFAFGVVPGLSIPIYNTPYIVRDLISAANIFGYGRFTRALGELIRQGATSIIAMAVYQESDIPNLADYIRDISFDIMLPVGLTATSSRLSVLNTINFNRMQTGLPILTVLPVDPTIGTAALLSNPWGAQAGTFRDGTNPIIAYGRMYVFTLDQLIINPNIPSQYQADAAPTIAGLIANTPVSKSITNESIKGVGLTTTGVYDSTDAKNLANAGYLVLRNSARKGITPYLGVTGTSTKTTDIHYSPYFHQISTMRIANYVETQLRQVTIGNVGKAAISTTVSNQVSTILGNLQTSGIIQAYTYQITIAAALGSITVAVSILPPYETTYIGITTRVSFTS